MPASGELNLANVPTSTAISYLIGTTNLGGGLFGVRKFDFNEVANQIIALNNAGLLTKTFGTLALAAAGTIPGSVEVVLVLRSTDSDPYGPRWYAKAPSEPTSGYKFLNGSQWWVSVSGAGSGYDPADDQVLTINTTLNAGDVRRGFVLASASNRTFILPSIASVVLGDWIVLSVARGSNGIMTISSNDTIDGQLTRDMWDGESALLVATGGGWSKRAGITIPYSGYISRSTDYPLAVSYNNYLTFDSAGSDFTFHHHFYNSGNGNGLTPRRGAYRANAHAFVTGSGGSTSVGYIAVSNVILLDSQSRFLQANQAWVRPDWTGTMAKNSAIDLVVFSDVPSARVEADGQTRMWITEVPTW